MTLQMGNKRPLLLLLPAVLLWLVLDMTWRAPETTVVAAVDSISTAERRLTRLRQAASTVPGKEQVLKQAAAELETREKAIIQADTAAQAQAQLLEIARRTARALQPQPIEFGSTELVQQVTPFGQNYGEVFLTLNFTCQIEDLVNFLAELTAQPEAVTTRDMRVQARLGNKQQPKAIAVRMTLSGLVPRKLVPEKRGAF